MDVAAQVILPGELAPDKGPAEVDADAASRVVFALNRAFTQTERTVVACVRQLFFERSLSTTKIKRKI